MARTARLQAESATAGSPYTIVVKIRDHSVDDFTWRAQARDPRVAGGDPLTEFDIDAVDGTGDDEGKAILTIHCGGAVTRTWPTVVNCSLEQTADDDPGEPLPLFKWKIIVDPDITFDAEEP